MGSDYDSSKSFKVPIQVVIYVNRMFSVIFLIVMMSIYIFKSLRLPYYDEGLKAWDFISVFFYAFLEWGRLRWGSQGNQYEKVQLLLLSCFCTLLVVGLHIYYLLQYYVTRIEVIFNALALVFVMLEFILMGIQAFYLSAAAMRT